MQADSQVTPRARTLEAGAQLGRYTIVRRIGAGGMAELYLARARGIGRFDKLFALKLVLPHVADDPEFVGMFLDEARLAATLDHANIVHVVDIGRTGDDHFYAMEYIHGIDLRALVRGAGARLPLEVALTIVLGIASGLHYAHERIGPDGRPLGIVHRDVSPSNVLVTYDGVVKIVDFGIARAEARSKVTQAGVVKGKRGYMSPEQCRGDAVDRRSDVFGLGILLWELTVGMRLFAADNDYAVMSKIVFGMVDDPRTIVADYPAELAEITMRALSRDPERRHATARELAVEIERFVQRAGLRASNHLLSEFITAHFAIEPYPTSPTIEPTQIASRPTPRRTDTRAPIAAAAVAVALLAGGGAWWAMRTGEAERAPPTSADAAPTPEPTAIAPPSAAPREAPAAQAATPVADPEATVLALDEPVVVVDDEPTSQDAAVRAAAMSRDRPRTRTRKPAPVDPPPRRSGAPVPSRPNDLFPPTE